MKRTTSSIRRTSLLVYKHNHGLVRLFCPFEVISLHKLNDKVGERKTVQYVQFEPNLPYFMIDEKLEPCYWYLIVLR